MISKRTQRIRYIALDLISANLGILVFNCLRYFRAIELMHTQGFGSLYAYLSSLYVALGQCLLPICTILIFVFSGYYVEVIRKSRLNELLNTAVSISFATLGIFFIVLINDVIDDRIANYELVCMLWLSLFMFVYGARVIYTSYTIH